MIVTRTAHNWLTQLFVHRITGAARLRLSTVALMVLKPLFVVDFIDRAVFDGASPSIAFDSGNLRTSDQRAKLNPTISFGIERCFIERDVTLLSAAVARATGGGAM